MESKSSAVHHTGTCRRGGHPNSLYKVRSALLHFGGSAVHVSHTSIFNPC